MVLRENGVDYLRYHRILVTEDPREQRIATLDLTDQIAAEFVFYEPAGQSVLGKRTLAKRAG